MARGASLPSARSKAGAPGAPDDLGDLLAGDAFDRDALALAERSAGIGVWSIDLTTNRVRGTAQFYRIMGLEPTHDSVPVETIRALRHPEDRDRVVAGFRQALDGGDDSYEIEYRIIRPDGNLRWIFGRGRVIRDRSGLPVRYSGVDLDITDRKATEEALSAATRELERMNQVLEDRVLERTAALEAEGKRRAEAESRLHQAQKMEAVGQLTGGIAHDFNNILQVILGSLEIVTITLKRGGLDEPGGERRALIERVTATAQRAALSAKQLVQRLLAFSRQQPLAPKVIDVNALVGDMTEIIGRALGEAIDLETELASDARPVYADRNQLESVLLNLVVNARDAMPEGGRLCIRTGNEDVAGVSADVGPGSYVTLTVSDTGCGIAHEHLDRVFDPFFTTKDAGKGSGLGLSMAYGFVKQSGGHIRIDSEIGAGTHVKVFLPALERNEDGSVRGPLSEEPATDAPALRGSPPDPAANGGPLLSQPDR
jgi:PAS domain S-box-containing protein